jgi:hypothetical protein
VVVQFSVTIQTSPEAHPAFYTMDTRYFLGVKQQRSGADHPLLCGTKTVNGLKLYLCHPSILPQASHGVTFTF